MLNWTNLYFCNRISCETNFKTRYYNYMQTFRDQDKRYATKLSKAVWDLKDRNIQFRIKWSIADKAPAYKSGSSKCNLCLTEKLAILKSTNFCFNKRSEIIAKCRHRNKFKLKNRK